MHVSCIRLFCACPPAQGDLFLINTFIKSLFIECLLCARYCKDTALFLFVQEIKSKMETTSLTFPLSWFAGACVFSVGGIPHFPPPERHHQYPTPVPAPCNMGRGREEPVAGGGRPACAPPASIVSSLPVFPLFKVRVLNFNQL